MDANVGLVGEKKTQTIWLMLVISLMSILLHQSQVIYGVNISLADLFCGLLFIYFVYKKFISVPLTSVIFFLLVSIVVLFSAVFYVPSAFQYIPVPRSIVSDYVKLCAIFLYFVIGYNLSQQQLIENVVKWYSYFGLFVGLVGIFFTVLNIQILTDILYFGGARYRGFMIDPNYFSILQITALVYFSRVKKLSSPIRLIAIMIIIFSVFISGSKTGIITLICYTFFRFIEYIFFSKKELKTIIKLIFFTMLIAILVLLGQSIIQSIFNQISSTIPAFARIQYLFTDFSVAISENGSGREDTWMVASLMTQISPMMGVGIGTFTNLSYQLYQFDNVAHNTFLQLLAEWGIPLAVLFFLYIFFVLFKASKVQTMYLSMNLILRDIMIILLIGSMAISLNNARVLWLVMGGLISIIQVEKK